MPQEAVLSPQSVIRRNPDLAATEMDGVTVMFRAEKEKYYGFEAVGSRIWQLVEQPTSIAEVCAVLQAEFDVSAAQCERETLDFVHHLYAEDLVVVVDEASR